MISEYASDRRRFDLVVQVGARAVGVPGPLLRREVAQVLPERATGNRAGVRSRGVVRRP